MLRYEDLHPLTAGIPKMAVLTPVVWGPVSRIASGFVKSGLDVTIFCLDANKHFHAEHDETLAPVLCQVTDKGRNLYNKQNALTARLLQKHPTRTKNFEAVWLNPPLNAHLLDHLPFKEAGVVFMARALGLFDWENASTLFKGKACVMRCSTALPFTGGCTCSAGCMKWKLTGCSACPQLGSSIDGDDVIYERFTQKLRGLHGLNLGIATPSSWLGKKARESLLLNQFQQATVPTSIDLSVYHPQDRVMARAVLELPQNENIILAGSGTFRENKGFHVLCAALDELQPRWSGNKPLLCYFGRDEAPASLLPSGYECRWLGYFDDVHKLATAYAAADVFVSPSFEDNLPNTVNEALSCGTPVICFDTFSSEDVVLHGETGFVARHPGLPLAPDGSALQNPIYHVEREKCRDLGEKIHQLLTLPPEQYAAMRIKCRQYAEKNFSPVLETARYLRLYRQLLGLPSIIIDGLADLKFYIIICLTCVQV